MPKKVTTYVVFFAFINLIGCYSYETISFPEFENELKAGDTSNALFINTFDQKKYHCSGKLFSVEQDSIRIKGTIVFSDDYEEPYAGKIAINDIESIEVESLNEGTTALVVGSVVGCSVLLLLFASETKSSGSRCSYRSHKWD
jgi:hypothetical protein